MRKFTKLLSVVMVLALAVCFATSAFAYDTDNDPEILDMTHLDVKADAKYYAEIDGETVVVDGTLVPETIVVSVVTPATSLNYDFGSYSVQTLTEKGMTEYRIYLDGTDGALLNAIDWDGASFYMNNVYVSARVLLADAPAVLADALDKTADGVPYADVTIRYTGMQECTGHNGLRSEGNQGLITGVDLYLSYIPGISVETPVEPTEEPTEAPTEPEVEPTEVPTEPEVEPTEEPTEAPTQPEPPVDEVPETGDTSIGFVVALMGVSVIGMAATALLSKKLKYTGKW